MKKIGIMTMHRIKNYGSFLQAYGLAKHFRELHCNVDFVDYRFEGAIVNEKKSSIKKALKLLRPVEYIKRKVVQEEYNRAFEQRFIPELCGKRFNYRPNNIDALVIGSDEVFNCLQGYPVGYSRELFGKGFERCPTYSYAASFGQVNYSRLEQYNIASEVAGLLSRFKKISVRDKNSEETVLALTGKKPMLHLDPVLITDYSDETIDNVSVRNYIILYAYPGRLTSFEQRTIKKFAKEHGKTIVSFGMYQKIANIDVVVHPFEIFSYFKHADFVITDTFHGSIFAIKSHTNFCTITRKNMNGNSNKLEDLLFRLKQNDRIIRDISDLDDYYSRKPNFEETDKIIEEEAIKSRKYLKEIAGVIKNE